MNFNEFLNKENATELNEASKKSFVGNVSDYSWAFKIDGVDGDFPNKSFGQQMSDASKIKEFKEKAKLHTIGSKGKSTLASVKAWIKENKPSQYYAKWKSDSSSYKDDCVDIHFIQ